MSDLTEIQRSLGRVEGKLDTALSRMDKQDKRSDGLEERLQKVERRQWVVTGFFTAIGVLLGFGGGNGLKP
jgi:isochorismate hydrolase